MKRYCFFQIIFISICACTSLAQTNIDLARIEVYVTPYYDSRGPVISVGPFSKGLASKSDADFLSTIGKMRQSWSKLSFQELYVAAMCLYDRGYRKESIYWFYTAQYRGRLFVGLLDQKKIGGIGDNGFELLHAQNGFFESAGMYINGYAFTHVDYLSNAVQRVQKEGLVVPKMKETYRRVAFRKESEWEMVNKQLNEGMSELMARLDESSVAIKKRRIEEGTEAQYSELTSRDWPSTLNEDTSSKSSDTRRK